MAVTKVQKLTARAGVCAAGRTNVSVVNHCVAENHRMT